MPVNSASAVLRYSAQRGLDGSFNASPAHMFTQAINHDAFA